MIINDRYQINDDIYNACDAICAAFHNEGFLFSTFIETGPAALKQVVLTSD